jgi:hypothetical protein
MFTVNTFIKSLTVLLNSPLLKGTEVKFFDSFTPCFLVDVNLEKDHVFLEFEVDHECDGSIDGKTLLQEVQILLEDNPKIGNFPVKFNNEVGSMCMKSVISLSISEETDCIELF